MDKISSFFLNYVNAMGVSKTVKRKTVSLINTLIKYDPLNKTKFEVSFKLMNDTVPSQVRFLNMDANAYSCKSQHLFLMKLQIYKKIIDERVNNPGIQDIFRTLSKVSSTPMDLYFGVGIEQRNYLFAFWLIFGGVKKTGEVSFWPYDFDEIISKILSQMKFKKPRFLREDILNFGFDVNGKNIFYKLYYLLKNKETYFSPFVNLMKRINSNLSNFKYFYFFSQMYNNEGECIKKKLFIEFLEDIYPHSEKIEELLRKVLDGSNKHFELQKLLKIIKLIDGRISLISFEPMGFLTFYIRP